MAGFCTSSPNVQDTVKHEASLPPGMDFNKRTPQTMGKMVNGFISPGPPIHEPPNPEADMMHASPPLAGAPVSAAGSSGILHVPRI